MANKIWSINKWLDVIRQGIDLGLTIVLIGDKNEILECFTEILKEKSLSGKFRNFNNEFKINEFYEKVIKKNEKKFKNLKI